MFFVFHTLSDLTRCKTLDKLSGMPETTLRPRNLEVVRPRDYTDLKGTIVSQQLLHMREHAICVELLKFV